MANLLSNTLLALTRAPKAENQPSEHKPSYIEKVFSYAANIYPLEESALLLLNNKNIILSLASQKPEFDNVSFAMRVFPLSESVEESQEVEMTYNKTFLYLLKNIPTREGFPPHTLILISKEEQGSPFSDLKRISRCLKMLSLENRRQHKSYQKLLYDLDAIDDGISACDSKGNITFINSSACKIIGSSKEATIGKNLHHPPFKDAVLTQVLESGKPKMDFEYNLHFEGNRFRLMNSAYPVFDSEGNITGAIDIFRRIKRSYQIASNMAGYRATYEFKSFIGSSRILQDKINLAKEFSKINKNTLIEGESGTGKDLFAQSIHNFSDRNIGPFVAINCANYPVDLFDSELFGYDEGAFTGAKKGGKSGKFELADGGTLFLDEIGEMPMQLQAKLLRVLETKEITRLGSNKTINIDVRIIAATNQDLETLVSKKQFREDLYYRLKVLYLKLPPLRERGPDIQELCEHFIGKINRDLETPVTGLSDDALSLIYSYGWPGNIRQLENILSIAIFICGGGILEKRHLVQAGLDCVSPSCIGTKKIEDSNRDILIDALAKNNYNIRQTAEALGISRNTIYRKMKKYDIERF